MTWEAWLTLLVLLLVIALLVRDLVPPAVAVLGGTVVLMLARVIETEEAFSGFSNPAPITVAALFIIAGAASKTGLLQPLVAATLGGAGSDRASLARLLPPVAAASSVLNNTPIVAILVPEVGTWSARHGRSVSRFLMPLSFAAILGGVVTLIGTSTNLVVSGLLEAAGHKAFAFFEITKVGLPVAIVGVAAIVGLAPKLLPDRRSAREELSEDLRQYVVDMVVSDGGTLDGKTVEDGGLRHLAGVFLVQLERAGDVIAPVNPTTRLRGGDRLRFAGKADNVVDLHAMPGLVSGEESQLVGFDPARSSFFETVVGASSPLIGKTLREAQFRSTYQAAVVAIHRAGHLVDAKLGEVRLRVGDTLVLLSDPAFRSRWRDRRDFLLVSPLGANPAPDSKNRATVAIVALGVVLLAATNALPVVHAALLGAMVLLGLRVISPGEARRSIDLDVVLLIAGGFGLAAAMQTSGLADTMATGLVDSFGALGSQGALFGVVVGTVILTELVSNTAAALIIFPIAIAAAESLSLDPRGFAIAVAVAASASFLTPVGYQTNTMVYGPGGYRYTDYLRLGAPLTALVSVVIVFSVPVFWPL